MDLNGKLALVTGSTSGIGLCIAKALAKVGCDIIIHGLGNEKTIADIVTTIKSDYGVNAEYIAGDLLHVEEIKTMVANLLQRYPTGVDILINNAGITTGTETVDGELANVLDDQWDNIVAVNLSAPFHLTKRLLPFMKTKGWGRIVNMASVAGIVGFLGLGPYTATKHGIIGLTKAVALEVASHGVTCNAVCPGVVDTPLVTGFIESCAKGAGTTNKEMKETLLKDIPTGKLISPGQVAEVVLFLVASGASGQMNGADYKIDYAMTAK